MSDKSAIQWTDATWNPTRGCTEIAPGCAHCYAKTFAERFRGVPGHPYEQGFDPRLAPDKLTEPLKWKTGRRIFVDSMSDLFHEAFPFEYIAACFGVMAAAHWHTFQVLTKRVDRALEFFEWMRAEPSKVWGFIADPRRPKHNPAVVWAMECFSRAAPIGQKFLFDVEQNWPLPNVHIGTSLANQTDADKTCILEVPAVLRFLSIEPLISPIDLSRLLYVGKDDGADFAYSRSQMIGWVIVGGESGAKARPCEVTWVRSLVEQCAAANVACFVKQLGGVPYEDVSGTFQQNCQKFQRWPNDSLMLPLRDIGPGKWSPRLRNRHGSDMDEWPLDLRVREFPA